MKDQNQGPKSQSSDAGTEELSRQEQEKISGGWGDIKGGSTDDKHKD